MLRRAVYFGFALLGLCLGCSESTPSPESSDKDITAFSIDSPHVQGDIDQVHGTINVALPGGTLPLDLVTVFETTGKEVDVDGVVQESGVTANYFIPSRTYTVTAADGSSRDYIVTMSLPSSGPVEGIDVSYYQGEIDWVDVKASGKVFAYIRANNGTATDTKFTANWAGSKAAGIYRGTYYSAVFGQDAENCANDFINLLSSDFLPGDLPPMLCIESAGAFSSALVLEWIQTWLDTVETSLGIAPVVYTGASFWNDIIEENDNSQDHFFHHPLCIAHWTTAELPTYDMRYKYDWAFWEYSSTGHVDGILGATNLIKFQYGIFRMLVLGKTSE